MRLNYLISTALVVLDASSQLEPEITLPGPVLKFKQKCEELKLLSGWNFDPKNREIMATVGERMQLINEATSHARSRTLHGKEDKVLEKQLFRAACGIFYKGNFMGKENFTPFEEARVDPEKFVIESLRDMISDVCKHHISDVPDVPKTKGGFIEMKDELPISELGREELIVYDDRIQSLLPAWLHNSHDELKEICQLLFRRLRDKEE